MASTSLLSLPNVVSPLSSARRNIPRKSSSRNPKRSTAPLLSPAYRSGCGGGDATTYTRLPPKDLFLNPSLEVRLHDSLPLMRPMDHFSIQEFRGESLRFESDEDDESAEEFIVCSNSEPHDEDDDVVGVDLEELGEEDDMDLKEKGVPAVMRCFDRAKIYVKAGDGGNGVVAFRREKFVPYGDPSGGDGGKGGDVYVEVDGSMNSLLPFRKTSHFRAGRGGHGQGRKQAGAKGEDVVVKVAPGTVIREAMKGAVEGELLLELLHTGQRALCLVGGVGEGMHLLNRGCIKSPGSQRKEKKAPKCKF